MCKLNKLTYLILLVVVSLLLDRCEGNAVETGLDVLVESGFSLIRGKRVGVICNHSSVSKEGYHIVDLIVASKACSVKAIFAPEHGFRGKACAGERVSDYIDEKTGIRIYSLYGKVRKPTSEMLKNIDLLIYDIQDVGARFYTYISTLKYAMEAACENGKSFVVLDRPNPIRGDLTQGPVLDKGFESFVGSLEIPIRYGLTPGEVALFINKYLLNQELDLTIVPMRGWKRKLWYDETGLKFIKPSSNIPDLETAILYPGFCLFEGTNVSEGRGTYFPFKIIGAPWIDGDELAVNLSKKIIYGVTFQSVKFRPMKIEGMVSKPKYLNRDCEGVKITITDREVLDPIKVAIMVIKEIKVLYPDSFKWKEEWIDKLYGSSELRSFLDSDKDLEELFRSWSRGLELYKKQIKDCMLYN